MTFFIELPKKIEIQVEEWKNPNIHRNETERISQETSQQILEHARKIF